MEQGERVGGHTNTASESPARSREDLPRSFVPVIELTRHPKELDIVFDREGVLAAVRSQAVSLEWTRSAVLKLVFSLLPLSLPLFPPLLPSRRPDRRVLEAAAALPAPSARVRGSDAPVGSADRRAARPPRFPNPTTIAASFTPARMISVSPSCQVRSGLSLGKVSGCFPPPGQLEQAAVGVRRRRGR